MIEQVVLLDEAGQAIGSAPKAEVHHDRTPLHLAFSCYVFDPAGRLLVTQRALHKPTWPGTWTNTVCGHPAPGEDLFDAVRRRTAQELRIAFRELQVVLPGFRYRATMSNGVMENEVCPVFTGITENEPQPDPDEVAATRWLPWDEFRDEVLGGSDVSPWCVAQVAELAALETGPGQFRASGPEELPHAARG